MYSKSSIRFVALLAVLALAIPVMAKPVSKYFNFPQPATLGTTQLKAGEYHLLIDGNKVTVERGRQVVAQVEGRWEQREAKARENSILFGANGEVKELRFAGDARVLVLATP